MWKPGKQWQKYKQQQNLESYQNVALGYKSVNI